MISTQDKQQINWYRTKLPRGILRDLSRKSDFKGLIQAGGHLGLLCLSGAACWYAYVELHWSVFLLALFVHGTFYSFLLNGFHELCHNTVFKTKSLNNFFLKLFSFLGSYNYVMFIESHSAHHKYTLHPPKDMEVVLPIMYSLKDYLLNAVVNPKLLFNNLKSIILLSFGRLSGDWEKALFPESEPEKRRVLFNWSRTLLCGHTLIFAVSIYFELWLLPLLTTFAPSYGRWLLFLCNNTQHVGLRDNVPDFRLCSRTILLNPFLCFLYWHMNYHIEHHMYASVPCYHLKKLHKLLKDDLPHCPKGLVETWKEIVAIMKKQKKDPSYQYVPKLPLRASARL